jgi:hypothetical protein
MTVRTALKKLAGYPPKEPVFILRGRDQLAIQGVIAWIQYAKTCGVPKRKIRGAMRTLCSMRTYVPKRMPD